MPIKTMSVKEFRDNLSEALDGAKIGETQIIVRHSKPIAALIPVAKAELLRLVDVVLRELGEAELISRDAAIVAAVKRADEEIAQGKIIWYAV